MRSITIRSSVASLLVAAGAVAGCTGLSGDSGSPTSTDENVGTSAEAIALTPTDLCEFTIYSRLGSTLQDRATSTTGFVGSASAVTLGNDSGVVGHLRSTGTVLMNDRSFVQGNVTAGGSITRRNNTLVTGTVSPNTPVPVITIPTKSVTFGTTDVNVNNGQTRSLAPGNYRDVHAFGGSTLNLRSGVYNLRSLIIESSSVRVNLDIASGPIDINVQNEIRFGDGMLMALTGGTNPRQVRYYSNWSNQLSVGNDLTLFGVVTAPNADIVAFSRTTVRGSLFGRRVSIGPDNRVSGACSCGNGFLDPNEQCDDGNSNPNDACTNTCTVARCGDGVVRTGVEECDDGNTDDFDTCTTPTGPGACEDGSDGECGCEFRPLRKNLATISAAERTALINAMRALDDKSAGWLYPDGVSSGGGVSFWDKQDQIHEYTHVHGDPSFLSWHRELLNRFERLLRRVDPSVALHYWDWTTDPILGPVNLLTPTTFGLGYFGDCSIGQCAPPRDIFATPVRAGFPFDIMDSVGPPASPFRESYSVPTTDFGLPVQMITRNVVCDGSQFPSDASIVANPVWSTTATESGFRQALTQVHDNVAHSCIGGTIVDPHTAFEDPFVFIMHSNVDRIWAMWQTSPGQAQRLAPATTYGDGSGNLGDESNDPDLLEVLQPWGGEPPICPGFVSPPPACPLFPWDPNLPPASDPDWRVVDKSSKDPSVVRPPRYDTNGTL
jgi:cysteine-rich repeat protein